MFPALPRPTIFAHRGSSAHAPENTLPAFRLALEQNADALELDAKLTADGKIVVIHDQSVDRTTEGSGLVKKLTLAELRQLDAGSHFDIAFRGELIPTLDEVLDEFGRRTFINIELTNYTSPWDSLPESVCRMIKKMRLTPRVMFSSFNPIALLRAHRLLPEIPLGLLCMPGKSGFLCRTLFKFIVPHQAFHPEASDVTADLVRKNHQKNRRVNVYTVNNPAVMRDLFTYAVDGIFTDDPLLARQILAAVRSEKER
jgi:glycerophosphoryl diester phosphodiesterase